MHKVVGPGRRGRSLPAIALRRERNTDAPPIVMDESTPVAEARVSRAGRGLAALTRQAAASSLPVLITGADGVGKARLARDIHRRSARACGPFVIVGCTRVSGIELDAKLFGHVRLVGDAVIRLRGAIERASGGTLYLDGLGSAPRALQQKLAATVTSQRLYPPGHDVAVPVDFRLIASIAHRPGLQRRSSLLLGALATFPIDVPPHRDRGGAGLAVASEILAQLNARNRADKRFSLASLCSPGAEFATLDLVLEADDLEWIVGLEETSDR